MPERNVFCLTNGRDKIDELFGMGILATKDIPEDYPLNPKQTIQVKSDKADKPYIEPKRIKEFLNKLIYPLYLLDFETINPAIPMYDNSCPFEQVPFQYSLHVLQKPNGKAVHYEYLPEDGKDPRERLFQKLQKELGNHGSVVAFYDPFEQGVFKKFAERFPDYKSWVDSVLPRFIDLFKPFFLFHYYHPKQNGSASIKAVLPALTGKSYEDMEIGEGTKAGMEFLRITHMEVPAKEREQIRKSLLEYCGQDTEGMIDILNVFYKV